MGATVLVTGGAGYIGSHLTYALLDRGYRVVVLDDLSTGIRTNVSNQAELIEGNIADQALVRNVLQTRGIEAVFHLAASVVVPESNSDPLKYYRNNTAASRTLIEACVRENVGKFIFSSTAAVYGMPNLPAVAEDAPESPISPYGRSKLITEWMLQDAARAHDFSYVAFRCFNVAGADPKGRTGQSTPHSTHLIKRACHVACGRAPYLDIYGTDFATPDGTAIRDYVHVADLVDAQLLALEALDRGARAEVFNCGYGHGTSVREIIAAVEQITGKTLVTRDAPRRAGDPPALVADARKLKQTLNWVPRYADIATIIGSALAWEQIAHD